MTVITLIGSADIHAGDAFGAVLAVVPDGATSYDTTSDMDPNLPESEVGTGTTPPPSPPPPTVP